MTAPKETSWIDRHLPHILAAVATGYAGFLTAQSSAAVTVERMTAIEARSVRNEAEIAAIKVRIEGRTDFMTCAVRTIDQLNSKANLRPPCQLGIPD